LDIDAGVTTDDKSYSTTGTKGVTTGVLYSSFLFVAGVLKFGFEFCVFQMNKIKIQMMK
jgi:hypothetical protein